MSRLVVLVLAPVVLFGSAACSSSEEKGELEWVAGLHPGDCVDPGNRPSTAIIRMRVVSCRERHAMEVYARLPYPPVTTAPATPTATPSASASAGIPLWKPTLATTAPPTATASSSEYPGRDVLRTFAREACAERFRAYLGSNPREPSYFLTYLFPSVASWTAASAQRPKLGPLARLITSSVRSDRSVVCFVRTTGPALTASVRGPVTASPTTTPSPTNTSSPTTPERIENT